MSDFNILNRATFDDKQLRHTVKVQPFIHEGNSTLDLKGMHNVLWIKQINWRFMYKDVGVRGADQKRRPPKPILVTVADIIENESKPYPPFIQPKPVVGKVPIKVINTNLDNNHQLVVEFLIDGVLVKPKEGASITLKEMMSFIMMSSDKRGELAMAEAVTDKIDEQLSSMGLGSLREKFPGGLGALTQLPTPVQNMVLNAMAQNGDLPPALMGGSGPMGAASQQPMAALPMAEVDPEKETSAFMGDLIACNLTMPVEELKRVAKDMVEKGWRKV